MARFAPRLLAACALLASAACEGDFDPYELLTDLRVLALRAEPPAVAPAQSATLSALTFVPEGESPVYQWSWCPIVGPRELGYPCAVEEAELQALADALAPGAVALPPFDLGTQSTAVLAHFTDGATLQRLCEAVGQASISGTGVLPDCARGFDVVVRLDISTESSALSVLKRVFLAGDPASATNTNPQVSDILGGLREAETSQTSILQTPPPTLRRSTDYHVTAVLDPANAERFTPEPTPLVPEPVERDEILTLSWFITTGELDNARTTYIEDEVPFADLTRNIWRLDRDKTDLGAHSLYVVVRDERGGVGWLRADVDVAEASP